MKKQYLLLSAAMLLVGAAHAQGTELFFSEYDEGAHMNGTNYGGTANSTGNERAIEVFNPTTSVVSLNSYSVRRYSNGSTAVTEEERMVRSNATQQPIGSNTISPQAVFVLACGQATLPAILSAANQFSVAHAPTAGPTVITGGGTAYFSGNDAMALVRYPSGTAGQGTGVIIDMIGIIGNDPVVTGPGTTWSGTNPADGTPPVYVSSANQSIMRRPTISTGLRVIPTVGAYNIADQWKQYSTAFNGPGGTANPGGQLYNRLGEHNDYTGPNGIYGPLSTLAKFNDGINIYPNPASGTATVELKDVKVGSIVVLNNLGQRIVAQPSNSAASQTVTLDVSGLKTGLYFVQFISADGQTRIFKELLVK